MPQRIKAGFGDLASLVDRIDRTSCNIESQLDGQLGRIVHTANSNYRSALSTSTGMWPQA